MADTNTNQVVQHRAIKGEIPLTPIQHWFFEQNLPEPHYFNQAVLLEVSPTLQPSLLEQVIQHLIIDHDVLRMRYVKDDSGWQVKNSNVCQPVPFQVIDISMIPKAEQQAVIEQKSEELQSSLNLAEGPLLRSVVFQLGNQQPGRLLLIIHHLAVDGVSWGILLKDLVTAYQQLEQGQAVQLPPKTTSFEDWAIRQQQYAQSATVAQELDFWLFQSNPDIQSIPIDFSFEKSANTEGSSLEITVSLTESETHELEKITSLDNTQIDEVILTALVQSFAQWTGSGSLFLEIERPGREKLFEDVDLSRTVGWFTSITPILLQLGSTKEDVGEDLKTIKQQLRRIPENGINYGILRYLSLNPDIKQALKAIPSPQISFIYLGKFNEIRSEPLLLGFAPEIPGRGFSPKGERPYLLDIAAMVVENKLQFYWIYSQNVHRQETIEHLANDYIARLREIIKNYQSTEVGG